MLKLEDPFIKRQYVHATSNTTTSAAFTTTSTTGTTPTTISIAPTCKTKSIKIKISGHIEGEFELNLKLQTYRCSYWHFSYVLAIHNCIKLKFLVLDEGDVKLTKRQYVNTTAATSTSAIIPTITMTTITTMPKGIKVKFSRNIEG